MKQTPISAKTKRIQRRFNEQRGKNEALARASDYLRDLIAGGEDKGKFLRFVLTRSQCEFEWFAIQAIHKRGQEKSLPRSEIGRVAEFGSKLANALDIANSAFRARSSEGEDLFAREKVDQVVELRDAARRLLRRFSIKGSSGHPPMDKRIYTVSALLPYLHLAKLAGRADGAEPEDTGTWAWLTKWDNHFGPIHVIDHDWLGRKLCVGGLMPEDFDERSRFVVKLPKNRDKAQHTETILRWWTGISHEPENHEKIIDSGAAFIAWGRRLFKKPIMVGDIGSTLPLERAEIDFAASASRILAHHCRIDPKLVLDRWAKIRL